MCKKAYRCNFGYDTFYSVNNAWIENNQHHKFIYGYTMTK